jgi:hypothetical protein
MEKTVLIELVFLLFFVTSAIGKTYYVSPNGSDSNPGTKSSPWATLQKAESRVVAGDTVIVRDGIYTDEQNGSTLFVRRSGTNNIEGSGLIVFRAENAHGAIIDGKKRNRTGINIYRANYRRFEGFEIKDSINGIFITGDNIYIYNCKIHGMGRWYVNDNACDWSPGFTGIGSRHDRTTNVTIDSCEIYDIGRRPNKNCTDAQNAGYDHNLYLMGHGWTIINNLIYNAYAGWHIKIDGHDGSYRRPSHVIVNNVFAHDLSLAGHANKWGHIITRSDHGTNSPKKVVIENNIFYDVPTKGRGTAAVHCSNRVEGSITVRNNVTNTDDMIDSRRGGSCETHENFLESNNTINLPLGSFGMKDPENNDFSLTSEARYLIDKGISNNAPAKDKNGRSRPQGVTYDIGAYESISKLSISYDTLQAPSGLTIIE